MNPVIVKGGDKKGLLKVSIGDFQLSIDRSGGNGPSSMELMLVGLGACTYETVLYYMSRKELPVASFSVELRADPSDKGKFYDRIYVGLHVDDGISDKEKKIILNAAKTCRIHNTIENKPDIVLEVFS